MSQRSLSSQLPQGKGTERKGVLSTEIPGAYLGRAVPGHGARPRRTGAWDTLVMLSFSTDRLTLRPWTADDAEFIFDLYSRREVQRFLGRTPRVMRDRSEALARLATWMAFNHRVHGIWAVEEKHTGRLVGVLLLKPIPTSQDIHDSSEETEIGWHFHPGFWGRGYATEAAARILRHALESHRAPVVAVTNPGNTASQRVCERIGMRHLGQTARYYDTVCELYSAGPEALG
jgi:RimJ/RimL family protein N-acetyltransferase